MSQDPRLNSLLQYATSELGVGPTDTTASLSQRVENLERRLAAVERTPAVQTGAGAPTGPARNGTLYVDLTNRRLYVMATTWGFLGPLS